MVPSFCAIINNIPEDILKEYLLAYLNSKACLRQIKNLIAGTTIAILSSGQIKKLFIPIPELSIQEEIAELYRKSVEKIKLLERITMLEKEYLDSRFIEMED